MTAALIIVAVCGWAWGVAEWIRANGEQDRADEAELNWLKTLIHQRLAEQTIRSPQATAWARLRAAEEDVRAIRGERP